jgi:hypothetical protein
VIWALTKALSVADDKLMKDKSRKDKSMKKELFRDPRF